VERREAFCAFAIRQTPGTTATTLDAPASRAKHELQESGQPNRSLRGRHAAQA
jgi:hypothetical protein